MKEYIYPRWWYIYHKLNKRVELKELSEVYGKSIRSHSLTKEHLRNFRLIGWIKYKTITENRKKIIIAEFTKSGEEQWKSIDKIFKGDLK